MTHSLRGALSIPFAKLTPADRGKLWMTVLAAALGASAFIGLGVGLACWFAH